MENTLIVSRDSFARLHPEARCYRFKAGSHFPYVTHPAEYTAILEEVPGLAPASANSEVTL